MDQGAGTALFFIVTWTRVVPKLSIVTRWRLPVAVEDVDPGFLALLLTYEDARFHEHGGVDPKGLLRAVVNNQVNDGQVQGA